MKRRGWLVIVGLMLAVFFGQSYAIDPGKIREFHIRENDTTSYTLILVLDDAGQPAYFFRNIFTPVCLTGECKPVYINFYWDLLGNYQRFDFPPGEVLTKMDHKEFKQEDYDKLQGILHNPSSLLKDVAMNDLVGKGTENLADSVDAKAGATLKTVKNEVIDGAVYTCYTLWHIAHGYVVNEIRRITETYQDDTLLHRFLGSNNFDYQYWAMERVITSEGDIYPGFMPDVLKIVQGKNLFTARHALQKLSNRFFQTDSRQSWLWETYQKAGYAFQIAILKKLTNVPFRAPLAEAIAQEIPKSNQEQSGMMLKLLAKQPSLSDKAQVQLARRLNAPNSEQGNAIYQLLTKLKSKNQQVIAQLKTFERSATQTNK
ncbi:hypothetical protein IC229_21005 [Spirosoma sp. BT702]|uniref:Uncharacterized protein n=1 Tax=Spirosoma profusum TaxID=2771354 RepID=A0A927ATC2_9BACT|nr:hypothetical protein [Spirosoma profusum]MBD2703140.1 hypothetical protein [Spirosoma profusum]